MTELVKASLEREHIKLEMLILATNFTCIGIYIIGVCVQYWNLWDASNSETILASSGNWEQIMKKKKDNQQNKKSVAFFLDTFNI